MLKEICKKEKKWIYTIVGEYKGGILHHLECKNEDKVNEVGEFLKDKGFKLYFSNGSKENMIEAEMEQNETRIEINTKSIPLQIDVEYFNGNRQYYSQTFIKK